MKTSELTGAALDWVVAKCEGPESYASAYLVDNELVYLDEESAPLWEPSINWSQGGPIIERERMLIRPCAESCEGQWAAKPWDETVDYTFGHTPLIAAMRCYITSKLGDEVDVPDELQ